MREGRIIRERYRIKRLLGKGGMATVYLVEDQKLPGKLWALKEMGENLPPEIRETASLQFRKEAEILARLSHPRLPRVIDYFSLGGREYLVMEYLQGKTLQKFINENESFAGEEKIRSWGIELCEVLEYLHTQNPPIIFRDIKPGNIIVDPDEHLKLVDFGIARLFAPGKSEDTIVIGTPGYAAPEQYGRGQTDERSDIYSLGATLYCLATRIDPVDRPFSFLIPSSVNPKVSSTLDSIILGCLSLSPEKRFAAARVVKKALQGGSQTVKLGSEVTPSINIPDLELDEKELTFAIPPGRSPQEKMLTIRSGAQKGVRVTLSTNRQWLSVEPEFFEATAFPVTVRVNLKNEKKKREFEGRIVVATKERIVPVPVHVKVLPALWEREIPQYLVSILFFAEAALPVLGAPGIVVTYLALDKAGRTKQKIPLIVAIVLSLLNTVLFIG